MYTHAPPPPPALKYFVKTGYMYIFIFRTDTTLAQNIYFKYHSVDLPMENVKTGAAYVITPLPSK